ncbi:PREDICTED: uncharacterized protein LOC108788153 [Nanorana parkeri]|uniref:uncharacterized protein LOC108788153 n=1 Tax=Nanorana parkeri TaxID=125878 RepID=UPI00085421A2|nr:PREDICTED: uncharacterized protein LOC108788153 [Nanorana parkeri]
MIPPSGHGPNTGLTSGDTSLGSMNPLRTHRQRPPSRIYPVLTHTGSIDEGRLKDICGHRPKLGALHTAAGVKKWIPSIKHEIDYYLEQSQLSHYSERKIEEFEGKIEALKKEYQSHLWKLRRLDPSCKEHPWKPRGYTRKRTADGKVPSWVETDETTGGKILCTPVLSERAKEEDGSDSEEETPQERVNKPSPPSPPALTCIDPQVQDAPLIFNNAKSNPRHIWGRSAYNTGGETAKKLKDILLSDHPEQNVVSPGNKMEEAAGGGDMPTDGRSKGILGLDCYTSSDEES